jgi:hypothetical protein
MQCACTVLYCQLWPVQLCHIFSTLSYQQHEFRGKKAIEYKMCFFIFSTNLSETFLILRRIQRDTVINVHRSSCKVPAILVSLFNESCVFSTDFLKSVQWEPNCSVRADGQTNMPQVIDALQNFANAPKNHISCCT